MNLSQLEKKLKIKFKDKKLLEKSLIHKSLDPINNNEKLEFLGDRVLGFIISKKLIDIYPDENEGSLDKKFASLVNKNRCLDIANKLELFNYIKTNTNKTNKYKIENKILSDTCESIIGAIFLDQGYREAKKTILNLFQDELNNLKNIKTFKDPKSVLQEKLQSKGIDPPKYQTSLKSGPPHNPVFETKLFIGKKLIVKSEGFKKSDSEKKVATEALKLLESNFHSLEKKRSFIKKIIDSLRN